MASIKEDENPYKAWNYEDFNDVHFHWGSPTESGIYLLRTKESELVPAQFFSDNCIEHYIDGDLVFEALYTGEIYEIDEVTWAYLGKHEEVGM